MHVHVCKKDDIFRQRQLNHSGVGGGIYDEDALSKLSHTATVCVAVFFIDPNPNRYVGPKICHCMLPCPLCGIFSVGAVLIGETISPAF